MRNDSVIQFWMTRVVRHVFKHAQKLRVVVIQFKVVAANMGVIFLVKLETNGSFPLLQPIKFCNFLYSITFIRNNIYISKLAIFHPCREF